jgi:hypothetical protein
MMGKSHSIAGHFPVSAILTVLAAGLLSAIPAQDKAMAGDSSHDVVLTIIKSDSIVAQDSTVPIAIFAVNNGDNVVEATVSLVDNTTGDTIENWYPLFPPQSSDSIVLFWNTCGVKSGKHVLFAHLVNTADAAKPASNLFRTVTVAR